MHLWFMTTGFAINDPCHEDWSNMQHHENGRHCASCCKTVVDFTGWEVQAIRDYLIMHREEKPCGRFLTSQLEPAPERTFTIDFQTILNSAVPTIRKIAAAIFICFSTFFTSCEPTKTGVISKPVNPKEASYAPIDTVVQADTPKAKIIRIIPPVKSVEGVPERYETMGVPPDLPYEPPARDSSKLIPPITLGGPVEVMPISTTAPDSASSHK